MGEDAVAAFIDGFTRVSVVGGEELDDVGHLLTVLMKAFGRTLHRLLKAEKAARSLPYKLKFLFRELALRADLRTALSALVSAEDSLTRQFVFFHTLLAFLLEESSLLLLPRLPEVLPSLRVFQLYVIEAKNILLETLPSNETLWRRWLQPLREQMYPPASLDERIISDTMKGFAECIR